MSILNNMTDNKIQKIVDCVSGRMECPDNGVKVSDADTRNAVRSFINGLGFGAEYYESLSYAELSAVYVSFSARGDNRDDRRGLVRMVIKQGQRDYDTVLGAVHTALIRFNAHSGFHSGHEGSAMMAGIVREELASAGPVTFKTEEPAPVAVAPVQHTGTPQEQAIKALLDMLAVKPAAPVINEADIVAIVKKHAMATVIRVETVQGAREIPAGLHHKALKNIVMMLQAGQNVLMVGPAGSGKTTIAEQAAKILELEFYFNGALSSEYKLSGFVDANGKIVSTAFKRAYQNGGLYLFDEIDASMPDALLAFNAALSNGHADFPEGKVIKHEKFVCMAAANTYGRGADRVYVGRNQLDGASLDRFAVVNIDYDERLELALAANDDWTHFVQKIRAAIFDLKIRHIVSPRASINGAKMLAQGLDRKFVEDSAIWKGLDKDSIVKIRSSAGV